jgi:hypothetical protein
MIFTENRYTSFRIMLRNKSPDSGQLRIGAQVLFSTSRPVCTSSQAGPAAWAVPVASAAVPLHERPAVPAHGPRGVAAVAPNAARTERPDASAAARPRERRELVSTASTWSERPDAGPQASVQAVLSASAWR